MRAWRLWDNTQKRMLYPKDLGQMGIFMTASGDPVQYKRDGNFIVLQNVSVLFATGMTTESGHQIWDGDIVDVGIPNEFGSFCKARGVMKWDRFQAKWTVHLPKPPAGSPTGSFPVAGGEVVGNVYEQPNMIKENG